MRTTWPAALLVLGMLGGCGTGVQVAGAPPAPTATPYAGPLDVAPQAHGGALRRGGSAARALECDGRPVQGGGADYDSGLATTRRSATAALDTLLEEDYLGEIPTTGYRVERDDGDRVLLSYDVAGRTRVAFVAADGVTDWRGRTGWGVAAWAACDPSELPTVETERLGLGVWTDRAGRPVPTRRVVSYAGAAHCDWQSATFLQVGERQFVRDPQGLLTEFLRGRYDPDAVLPADARHTGWQNGGRQLWLTDDAAYLVGAENPTAVERWPAATQPIGCD